MRPPEGHVQNPLRKQLYEAPLGDRQNVQITIPDYRQVTLDVSRGGSFYLLDEYTGEVRIGK
ncbi:MAG: hypothetical protein EA424_02720 [Planctomycetaceae bacterium]|nr:MAG: hypothetical protein EA424_02720 [Planctomycetaceae bacterium]